MLRNLLLVVWMAELGMRLTRCRCPGFLVWLFFWTLLKPALGQRPLSVLPVVYRL